MSVLSITVVNLPLGTPVAAEILNADTGDVHDGVAVSGHPYAASVPGGTYVVRVVPPGLSRASAVVFVPDEASSHTTVTFTLGAPEAAQADTPTFEVGGRHGLHLLGEILGRRRKAARAMPPSAALHTAEDFPGAGLFVCDATGTQLAPVQVEDEYLVRRRADGGRPVYLCVTAGPDSARFVVLPEHTVGRIRRVPGADAVAVAVRPVDCDARALLDFKAQGRFDTALVVTEHVMRTVGARIAAGDGDAVAGCAVAYHLMSHPRRDWASQWIQALAAAFPASVDVSLLAAWHELDLGHEVDSRDVRARLIAAADAERGLPVYLQGLQLLRLALRRLSRDDRATGAWDPRLESAVRSVERYLTAADAEGIFTSFTGRGPLAPGVPGGTERVPETRPPADRDALHDALAALGTVTAGRVHVISRAPFSLTWRGLADGEGQTLSVGSSAAEALDAVPVALVQTNGQRIEVARLSKQGRAVFALPEGATGRLLVPEERGDRSAVLVPSLPVRHAAAVGDDPGQHVLTARLEFVVEPVRGQDRWRVTVRSSSPGSAPEWALVGQRSSETEPYLTFALPLMRHNGSRRESAVLLGRASRRLDWYALPEPVTELPLSGRRSILERSLSHAADAWTKSALKFAASSSAGEGDN